MDFAGKTALITGGSRGIGKGIAQELARNGANIAIVSRSRESVDKTAAELEKNGVKARGYACDVSSFEEAERVGQEVIEDFGGLDFLVNNAGITKDKLILRMKPNDWNEVLATNLSGVYNFVKAVAPQFIRQRRGRIVNISSVIGQIGNAGQSSYAASKAGIVGFTKSLAREFASRGITVNAVAPGYITTGMTEDLNEKTQQAMLQMIPLKRFGTSQDVANVVAFLLSDRADYITGQVINCDGGMVMC